MATGFKSVEVNFQWGKEVQKEPCGGGGESETLEYLKEILPYGSCTLVFAWLFNICVENE